METILQVDFRGELPAAAQGGVVAIGNFDGVHRGHSRLLAKLRDRARTLGVPAVTVTFDPHPMKLLRPESAPAPLCWPERRSELLAAGGADVVLVLRTSTDLLQLEPEEFFRQIIVGRLQARGMVEGPNFGFGRNRAGDVRLLREMCSAARMPLHLIDVAQNETGAVSSTRIRDLLREGAVRAAERLMGRPHCLRGTVAVGDRRGAGLGFPTANLTSVEVLLPGDGVYAVRVLRGGQTFAGACNIGPNPTFHGAERKVEVHLLDFAGDLYGETLEIALLERLRDVQAFGNVEALKTQLVRDVAAVQQLEESLPPAPDLHRSALQQTIEEWLRQEIEPGLRALGGCLIDVRLDDSKLLRIGWKLPTPALPCDTFALLAELEKRLRAVFPEVQGVRSSSTGG